MPEPSQPFFPSTKRQEWVALGALAAFLLVLYGILPSAGADIYASPDETANFIVAQNISKHWQASVPESLALLFPWLHPRSFVSVGEKITPVGFLGWPFLLSLLHKVLGNFILRWGGAFLLLSAAWPFFQWLRSFYGKRAAWLGTLVAFTAPSLIVYANRGLFPNGAVLAFGLWGLWMIRQLREKQSSISAFVLTGCVCSLAVAIRPVEMIWILPWWVWAGLSLRPTKKQWLGLLLGSLFVFIPVLWLAYDAYGSVLGVGYRVHDNLPVVSAPASAAPTDGGRTWFSLPYGFHPRSIVWNVRSFLFGLFWPWMVLLLAAVAAYVAPLVRARRLDIRRSIPLLLAAWTLAVLLFVYGSGLYTDHVRVGAVTIANSFLRYLLPLCLFFGWSFAFLWERFSLRPILRYVGIGLVCFLVAMGLYRALCADDEGLLTTRRELMRYEQVRSSTHAWFRTGDVIISERSDKVFFPEFRAVSPLPPPVYVRDLVRSPDLRVGLFARPLSQDEKDAWRKYGIDAQELASFARERLYRLAPVSP